MLWWAAFFIAGLVSPPGGRTGVLATLLVGGLGCGAIVGRRRAPWGRLDRYDRARFIRALASFTICGAVAVILWQTAGFERQAHGRFDARSPGSGSGSRGTTSTTGVRGKAQPAGIRSLSLPRVRSRLVDELNHGRLSKRARGLVGAVILGDRSDLDFELSETYSYVGIAHFLALSGMHLGAIAIPLSFLLSRLIRSKRRSDVALLVILCLYSAVACFPASLLRALFLTAAIVGYRFSGMNTDLIGSLVTGSAALVAIDSSIAFEAGFQLSFTAVCAIALVAAPLARKVEGFLPVGLRGTIAKAILAPALITCSVHFFTMPLVICLFNRVSLLSPVVNVIVSIPFAAFLYAGALYVFIPLAPLRALLGLGMNPLCRFLEAAPGVFARGPHAAIYRGDFHIDAYLCGVALVAWALQKSCPRKRMILAAGASCVAIAFVLPGAGASGGRGSRSVEGSPGANSVSRVAGGGAEYVGAGNGIIFLGDDFASGEAYRFTRALWARGVRRAGRCVVAPAHLRRNHGLFYLLKRIRIDEVLCSRYLLARDSDLPARLEAQGVRIHSAGAGDVFRDGRWRLEIIGPPFPPARHEALSGADAVLTWRLIAGRTTSLDLSPRRRYHADP